MTYVKRKKTSPLYSKDWLSKKYVDEGLSAKQIAELTKQPIMQVYRFLDRFGLRRKDD
jgi:hypothetical protein